MKLVLCEECNKFKSQGAYDYAFEDCCWDCKKEKEEPKDKDE